MEFNGLTNALNAFIHSFKDGAHLLAPHAGRLMAALISIDIVLAGAFTALGKHNAATLLEKGLFLGGWYWLTTNFGKLASDFVNSLVSAGLIAGGLGGGTVDHQLLHDPSRIAAFGLRLSAPILALAENASVLDGFDMLVYWCCYIIIMVGYLLMAIQVFLAVLEYYLRLTLCGILLPFGVWHHTRFIGEKAIGAIIGSGVKLMVLAFILAVADPLLEHQIKMAAGTSVTFNQLWGAVLSSGALVLLVWQAPSIAAGLVSGSPALSAAGAAQAAFTGGAAAAAGGAAALGATRLAAGAARAAGNAGAHVLGGAVAGAKGGAVAGAISGGSLGAAAGGAAGAVKGAAGAVLGSAKEAVSKAAGAAAAGPKAAYQAGAEAHQARAKEASGEKDGGKAGPAANTDAQWSAASGGYTRPSPAASGPAPGQPIRVGSQRPGSHEQDGAALVASGGGGGGGDPGSGSAPASATTTDAPPSPQATDSAPMSSAGASSPPTVAASKHVPQHGAAPAWAAGLQRDLSQGEHSPLAVGMKPPRQMTGEEIRDWV
jgi:type IV secretion system protein TrbL